MRIIEFNYYLKYLLTIVILCVVSCSNRFSHNDFSHLDSLYGQWTWSNGIDSLWLELEKGRSIDFSDFRQKGNDTTFTLVLGKYNLYNNGKLTSGNYEKETISGFFSESGVHRFLLNDRPEPDTYFKAYVFLSNPTKNRLKWELGTESIERIFINKKPKPIEGFDLPNNIVLTRIKD
jgi:hypothetical protein